MLLNFCITCSGVFVGHGQKKQSLVVKRGIDLAGFQQKLYPAAGEKHLYFNRKVRPASSFFLNYSTKTFPMMKMNAGGWIGLIGGGIGLAVGIASVIATSDSTGIYITIGILALIGGMAYLFYKLFFGPMFNTSRLQKVGIPGKATILEVKDTGVTINNNPQVKLVVEIKNSFGQKYTATIRTLVSRVNPNAYSAGMVVPVRIDPKNEKNVALDFTNGAAQNMGSGQETGARNEAMLKQELEQLQKDNDAIALSGRAARAIIKKYTWLGAYVNGNNPYVELELEVLPESMPAFSGKAKGVIGEAAVHKYQPGCEVYVKYDLYDNSKVVIDHS